MVIKHDCKSHGYSNIRLNEPICYYMHVVIWNAVYNDESIRGYKFLSTFSPSFQTATVTNTRRLMSLVRVGFVLKNREWKHNRMLRQPRLILFGAFHGG